MFDFVDRDFLLHKCTKIGINGNFFYSINALYNNEINSVQLSVMVTQWFGVTCGVEISEIYNT